MDTDGKGIESRLEETGEVSQDEPEVSEVVEYSGRSEILYLSSNDEPISEKGKEVKVKPKIVIEVGYEEIQKSPTYESGFALRFPRIIKIREDKGPAEASSLDYVKKLYAGQKKS